jgi:hypothetical protein
MEPAVFCVIIAGHVQHPAHTAFNPSSTALPEVEPHLRSLLAFVGDHFA